jgi:hypothetical protein
MPKFLYRIENKESRIGFYHHMAMGPQGFRVYFTNLVQDALGLSFFNSYHLGPMANGLIQYHNDSSRYGFCSLKKLAKWFGTSRRFYDFCAEHDMVIRRYSITTRFDSDRQSIAMIEDMNKSIIIPFEKVIASE